MAKGLTHLVTEADAITTEMGMSLRSGEEWECSLKSSHS